MLGFSWRKICAIGLIAVSAGCASDDGIAGPEPVATDLVSTQVISGMLDRTGSLIDHLLPAIVRSTPLVADVMATKAIGSEGGVVRAAGVELIVPKGALRKTTTITLFVPAGPFVQARFFPHGLKFSTAAFLAFDLRGTGAATVPADQLIGTYFTTPIAEGLIKPDELFQPWVVNGVMRFDIRHFSDYAPARRGYTAAGAKVGPGTDVSRSIATR